VDAVSNYNRGGLAVSMRWTPHIFFHFVEFHFYSASGCPGSHVIIRCHDQALDQDVVVDAAALAARQSKCTGNIIKVSMVRARDVQKPPGAKPGLVQLTGSVRTVTVNMKEAQARLERLDKTVLIN
jgi:hypothetical protein